MRQMSHGLSGDQPAAERMVSMQAANTQTLAPAHGLACGTKVMTLEGEMPVEFLLPGDRVLTRSGARVLRDVTVTVLQDVEVVLISAETLGVDRPVDDMIVLPRQMVMVRDWRAPALCGGKAGMVAAERLTDGEYIRAARLPDLRLFTLGFDAAEVVYAGGLELGCPAITVAA